MTTRTIPDCAGIDFSQVPILHGSHGSHFGGECCVVEWANRAAVCVPELRDRYGDPGYFADDHPSISRVVRLFCIGLNDGIKDDERRTQLLRPYITYTPAHSPEDAS